MCGMLCCIGPIAAETLCQTQACALALSSPKVTSTTRLPKHNAGTDGRKALPVFARLLYSMHLVVRFTQAARCQSTHFCTLLPISAFSASVIGS